MTHAHIHRLALACLSLLSAGALAQGGPKTVYVAADPLAPELPAPSPVAKMFYATSHMWLMAPPRPVGDALRVANPAFMLSYCVFPAVQISRRPDTDSSVNPPWGQAFEVALVNRAGAPAAPSFRPVVVPAGIPVDTFRMLEPMPMWCATLPGASTLPEVYLQVGKKQVRVEFSNSLPAPQAPITTRPPAGAASSPR
jgi:hypothetical protein